ncbi:hypothetical protein [Microbacterium sp. P01]|uniref:hypothetical protein n=1 Tax=unclassified Microbacterium TaxID=2609290 RepID=UPI00367072A2
MATPGYEISVWERYATELALAFSDNPARIQAVRVAYFGHGFDVDLIAQLSGFPIWRIRQALRDGPHRTD